MNELVYKINKTDAGALGAVRCIEGLRAAADNDFIWLRGIFDSPKLDKLLKQLPVRNTFIIDAQDNLFGLGNLTPVATLPQMQWQSLSSFISIELPVSVMPGKPANPINIKIIPSGNIKEGKALLTTLRAWKQYADTAPAARLNLLRFAVSETNDALIMGSPLPPLPGKEYWLTNDILLPSGYDFEIPLAATLIREKLNPTGSSIILFNESGSSQKIEKNYFVESRRSAIRLTMENNLTSAQ